jgi:hypothetical protein
LEKSKKKGVSYIFLALVPDQPQTVILKGNLLPLFPNKEEFSCPSSYVYKKSFNYNPDSSNSAE